MEVQDRGFLLIFESDGASIKKEISFIYTDDELKKAIDLLKTKDDGFINSMVKILEERLEDKE